MKRSSSFCGNGLHGILLAIAFARGTRLRRAGLVFKYDVVGTCVVAAECGVRVAELYVQGLAERQRAAGGAGVVTGAGVGAGVGAGAGAGTVFVSVRFGNVLGSAGSVVPILRRQIAAGGPVTVTHAEMKRYFMTIPEASQLVLQAAALGRGGEVFILDMGEPVSVLALAQDLIRLSGLEPGRDIEINFTGIRPGEKLFEELATDEERAVKTSHSKVFVGRVRGAADWGQLERGIEELLRAVDGADERAVYEGLRRLIPEFTGSAGASNGEKAAEAAVPAGGQRPAGQVSARQLDRPPSPGS